MGKNSRVFLCEACGHESPKWVGCCPGCEAWNTLSEPPPAMMASSKSAGRPDVVAAQPMPDISLDDAPALPTGVEEFDRAFGGGLVPGSVTLISGEPGIGKSTLLLQVAATAAQRGTVLYASGEESPTQLRQRAGRIGAVPESLWVAPVDSVDAVVENVRQIKPELVVVDSIQTIRGPGSDSSAGSVTQVRDCTQRLVTLAKASGAAMIIVGHVTKDGSVAGPRTMEHLVDTVASLDGDSQHDLRVLRTSKHRFGSTQELGVFEMTSEGLLGVPDASGKFLGDRRAGAAGSAVAAVTEGNRSILVEVQALVVPAAEGSTGKRSSRGVDSGRLGQLLAVLEHHAGLKMGNRHVYVSVVGGLKIKEPALDLPLLLAIASGCADRALPDGLVAWGEVGLGGEVRQVSRVDRRLAEAARLGFSKAIVPDGTFVGPESTDLAVRGAPTLVDALRRARVLPELRVAS